MLDTVGFIDGRSKSCDEIVDLLGTKVRKFDEEQTAVALTLSDDYAAIETILSRFAQDIGQAYGFYIGQDHTLRCISDKYPKLRSQITLVDKLFAVRFGRALTTMNAIMSKQAQGEWDKIKHRAKNEIERVLAAQEPTESQALDFIEEVRSRSEGNVESPILETLLMFMPGYEAHPGREFTEGYRYKFCSDGSIKAKGMNFCIEIPRTWKAKDANRPNIVKKFVNRNGRGFTVILVIIKDVPLPDGEVIVESDIEEMLRPEEIEDLLPKEAKYLGKGPIVIEGFPGYWIRYTANLKRVRVSAVFDGIVYALFCRNKLFVLQGQTVLQLSEQKSAGDDFNKYENVFDLVANSLVFNSVYQ